ncbi:MAG: transglycosylase domain-containing protein [Candidatus Aminicenantes bacterium]|nr:transglycosylase domain-containing protein [Candidatus Aminicenantes bacterium]
MLFPRILKSKYLWPWIPAIILSLTAAFTIFLFRSLPDVSDLKEHNPKTTALMNLRSAQAKVKGEKFIPDMTWISFETIPQLLKDTVRIAEDAAFYWHKGIDYNELKEAIKKDLREKKFSRGGSTITQQLAKNLYLSTEKSLMRKIKELLISRRLEKTLTKDRIFELYLNVIELGPAIFGVESAAWHYFGHSVRALTLEEIVRLAAIIPRPLSTDPRKDSPWFCWRGRWLLHKLKLYKYISEEDYQKTTAVFAD